MSPNFRITLIILTLVAIPLLSGCETAYKVLEGSSHACGQIHIEGPYTDSQGDVKVVKAPPEWTAEQIEAFCP